MFLFAKGAIVPQDAATGVPIGQPWIADRCKVSCQFGFTVTDHGLVGGTNITDAVKDLPMTLQAEYILSDAASTGHPVPSAPNRRLFLQAGFLSVCAKGAPFILYVRGWPPLKDYAMTSVVIADSDTELAVTIQVGYKRLAFTGLAVSPLAVDAELLAAGLVPL